MITSEKNEIIKSLIKLKTKKERDRQNLFFVEGERFTDEIPSNIKIEKYIVSDKFQNFDKYSKKAMETNTEILSVSENVFKKISETVNPQGIIAICEKMNYHIDINKNDNNFFIVLDRISDPGNLGTIIRTAEALGSNGIFLSKECVDIYNPKVLRSTMGSLFHVPVYNDCDLENLFDDFSKNEIKIICTHLEAENIPAQVDLSKSVAILIGNEANGILDKYKDRADFLVKIPMIGKVNSLNASVSSSIMIYEAMKQRMT